MEKWTYYFFDNMINIKGLDQNKIKIDEKSYKFLFTILDMWRSKTLVKHKTDSVTPLYLVVNKITGYIKESNEKKICETGSYWWEQRNTKKYEELWKKIGGIIRQIVLITQTVYKNINNI